MELDTPLDKTADEAPALAPLAAEFVKQALKGDPAIKGHGFIGDMRGSALIGRNGALNWLCLERFDAVPTFFPLLDQAQGGFFDVMIDGHTDSVDQRYLPQTNILETTLRGRTTLESLFTVTDFMPISKKADVGDQGADSDASGQVIRIISCMRGDGQVSVRIKPSFDWGRQAVDPVLENNIVSYPGHKVYIGASHPITLDDGVIAIDVSLKEDDDVMIVLSLKPIESDEIAQSVPKLKATYKYWLDWTKSFTYKGAHSDLVLRSALCLKLLTYAPTGAMVAAPTTSLPEAVGGSRNWDYRYVWSRDASFAVSALLNVGFRREGAEFLRFLFETDRSRAPLRILYTVDGGDVPDVEELSHLAGWRHSLPVRVGNDGQAQKQNEIYGEVLAALNLYISRHGVAGLCPSLKKSLPQFIFELAEAAIGCWRDPDNGIWELQGKPRHLLHSKGMCWVAIDRAMLLSKKLGLKIPALWENERAMIRAQCLGKGWNEKVGALTMEYGGTDLDMANLRLVLMGVMDANDPHVTATLDVCSSELGQEDLYRRYSFDDGLDGEEGAFIACSFWMVGVKTLRKEFDQAHALLEKIIARTSHLGLYAEEIDMATREQIGNFPQSFTHMALIHEIVRYSEHASIDAIERKSVSGIRSVRAS